MMKTWEVSKVSQNKKNEILKDLSLNGSIGEKTKKIQQKKISINKNFLVGKGDLLNLKDESIYLLNKRNKKEKINLTKIWEKRGIIKLAEKKISYQLRESTSLNDLKAYKELSNFHYRTDDENNKTQGRNSILILSLKIDHKKIYAGYIQLQMPVMMCKPRHEIFSRPFFDEEVEWLTWDADARKKYVNRIVRIGRVVTHPEWRGLKLAKVLIEGAKEFSTKKWHCKGEKPIFMEISAEMLKHIDFVSSSGFVSAGMTEGNLSRVANDLKYMNRGYEAKTGVMTMQKKYLKNFKNLSSELGIPFKTALKELEEICEMPEKLNTLSVDKWMLFTSAIRFPIPYFICGLTTAASAYLKKYEPARNIEEQKPFVKKTIKVKNLEVSADIHFSNEDSNRRIQTAFGLKKSYMRQSIIKNIKGLEINSGEILFLSGSSGSGKTLFLDVIKQKGNLDENISISGKIEFSENLSLGELKKLSSKETLIEVLSKKYGMKESIQALNSCGLSEAYIYLKRFKYLSEGQKYRAAFADLLLSKKNFWVIDEFCADLDPISAKVISLNLVRHVKKYNIVAVLAAANHDHFIEALNPEVMLELSSGGFPRIIYS